MSDAEFKYSKTPTNRFYTGEENDVVYEEQTTKINTYGSLQEMLVDEEYKIRVFQNQRQKDATDLFFDWLKATFADRKGQYISYADVYRRMLDAPEFKMLWVDWLPNHAFARVLTVNLNTLWKCGYIKKYRRGAWVYTKVSGGPGKSFGITYWIWDLVAPLPMFLDTLSNTNPSMTATLPRRGRSRKALG